VWSGCFGPIDTDLAELVRVAGARWAIAECVQTAKNETGLDHYQVRRYQAWYRHITLSMAAAAFLVITRTATKKRHQPESKPGLIPLTVNEIRKLFNRVAVPIQHTLTHTLHW
jgi:SRSO17 transposase